MKIGDVIKNQDDELWVITKTENGHLEEAVLLEKWIAKVTFIKHGDEHKTIQQVIEEYADIYVKNKGIKKGD